MGIRKVKIGNGFPNSFNVVIEIPCYSAPVKYELDKEFGVLTVDRVLSTPMFYPYNYGYIPQTLGNDGDPIDVLVVMDFPLNPCSVIECRAIGVILMEDEKGMDEKILAVPVTSVSSMHESIKTYEDLPKSKLEQLEHFFTHYKDLEKGKWVKISGIGGVSEAQEVISAAHKNCIA